jgi:hypothetical protein
VQKQRILSRGRKYKKKENRKERTQIKNRKQRDIKTEKGMREIVNK